MYWNKKEDTYCCRQTTGTHTDGFSRAHLHADHFVSQFSLITQVLMHMMHTASSKKKSQNAHSWKLFDSDREAGGCILVVTNLPNAYVADSSVAGCIFSLSLFLSFLFRIYLVFSFSTQCSGWTWQTLPLQQTRSNKKKQKNPTARAVYWQILQMSDHAKTLESRNQQLIHVMCCWARNWKHKLTYRPSRVSFDCLWRW